MTKRLLVLSTPRTGSNALCEAMTSCGAFGHVDGFFVGYGDSIAKDFPERVKAYEREHTGANYATKVMWDYIDHMAGHVGIDAVLGWLYSHDYYLKLYRKDTARQAVSWFCALGEGKWTIYNDQKRPTPPYNYAKIAWFEGQITSYNARTDHFRKNHYLPGLWWLDAMSYETMVAKGWAWAVRTICEGMLLDTPPHAPSVVQHQKQHNSDKENYYVRYTA